MWLSSVCVCLCFPPLSEESVQPYDMRVTKIKDRFDDDNVGCCDVVCGDDEDDYH